MYKIIFFILLPFLAISQTNSKINIVNPRTNAIVYKDIDNKLELFIDSTIDKSSIVIFGKGVVNLGNGKMSITPVDDSSTILVSISAKDKKGKKHLFKKEFLAKKAPLPTSEFYKAFQNDWNEAYLRISWDDHTYNPAYKITEYQYTLTVNSNEIQTAVKVENSIFLPKEVTNLITQTIIKKDKEVLIMIFGIKVKDLDNNRILNTSPIIMEFPN